MQSAPTRAGLAIVVPLTILCTNVTRVACTLQHIFHDWVVGEVVDFVLYEHGPLRGVLLMRGVLLTAL